MANFVIDKSRFNDEQLAQYEALVAIGKAEVDPEANKAPFVPSKRLPDWASLELSPSVAKPAMNHRLKRLVEYAKEASK